MSSKPHVIHPREHTVPRNANAHRSALNVLRGTAREHLAGVRSASTRSWAFGRSPSATRRRCIGILRLRSSGRRLLWPRKDSSSTSGLGDGFVRHGLHREGRPLFLKGDLVFAGSDVVPSCSHSLTPKPRQTLPPVKQGRPSIAKTLLAGRN